VRLFIDQGHPELTLETLEEAVSICKKTPQINHPLLWLEKTFPWKASFITPNDSSEPKENYSSGWLDENFPRNIDVMASRNNADFLDRNDSEDMDGFII
jgi:hypothetical protein